MCQSNFQDGLGNQIWIGLKCSLEWCIRLSGIRKIKVCHTEQREKQQMSHQMTVCPKFYPWILLLTVVPQLANHYYSLRIMMTKKPSVWYNPTNLHCRFRIQLNYLLMYSIVLQVHHEHLLDLMFMNLFRTSHHLHWQPLWNGMDAYFPYVGVNGCSRRTKIHSNEGGLAILLMHVLYSDCFLSTAQRLWKHSCTALWGSFKAFHWKICHLLSVSLLQKCCFIWRIKHAKTWHCTFSKNIH